MKIRRVGAVILALLLCGIQIIVRADNGTEFRDNADYLQAYYTQEDELRLLISAERLMVQEGSLPSIEQFSAKLGQTDLTVQDVKRADSQPVTYYCLVDVSGSVRGEQFEMEKIVLQALCDGLTEGDQMVIARMGNAVEPGAYLSDKDEINAAIQSLAVTSEDTNLYKGIIDSIKDLNSSNSATRRKCLVVLSDGEDYQKDGKTRSEADKAITESKIPIYTVALMSAATVNDRTWQEYAKELGSFARESVGGIDYNPALNSGLPISDVGKAIASSMKNDLVMAMGIPDISGIAQESGTMLLTARFQTESGATLDDGIIVYSRDLHDMIEEWKKKEEDERKSHEVEETPQQNDSEEENPDKAETDGNNDVVPPPPDYRIWVLIGALLVLLIFIAVMAIQKKKKRLKQEAEPEPAPPIPEPVPPVSDPVPPPDPVSPPNPVSPTPPMTPRRGRIVAFTAIGHEQVHIELKIEEGRELTLGRDRRADLVLNSNDKKLSGVHCRVRCEGTSMHVWDAGSRNGTAVNGVPLYGGNGIKLEDGETLRAGDFEYRVQFLGECMLS